MVIFMNMVITRDKNGSPRHDSDGIRRKISREKR